MPQDQIDKLDAFQRVITVVITPEGAPKGHRFGPDTTFWCYTSGMVHAFDRPELEMRNVPALFVEAAGGALNEWAFYSVEERAIKAGEKLGAEVAALRVLLQAVASPDTAFWGATPCLRLVLLASELACAKCAAGEAH